MTKKTLIIISAVLVIAAIICFLIGRSNNAKMGSDKLTKNDTELSSENLIEQEISEEIKRICGLWSDSYPVPNSIYGYGFLPDGAFVYNIRPELPFTSHYYIGSVGAWKLLEDNIYVNVSADFYWKNSIIIDDFGEISSGEGNSIIVETHDSNDNWIEIGTIKEIHEFTRDTSGTNDSFSPNVISLNILNPEAIEKKYDFFQLKYFDDVSSFSVENIQNPLEIYRYLNRVLF